MDDAWKLLHVLVAFWFVAGLVGRSVTIAQVRRETDLGRVESLMAVTDRFEKWMVRPGSGAVLLLGLATMVAQDRSLLDDGWLLVSLILYVVLFALVPTVFLPRGKRYEAALEGARSGRGARTAARARRRRRGHRPDGDEAVLTVVTPARR